MVYNPSIIDADNDSKIFLAEAEKNWSGYFGKYSPFYHIATEDTLTYVQAMGNSFTTGLVIGSSGDQGIALNQRGAKDIYFFDLNRADVYWLILKRIAFITLKRKDFLDFMISDNGGEILDYRLYEKIKNRLPIPIRIFWDNAYKRFGYNNEVMALYLFRDVKKHTRNCKAFNNYYANNETYYATQRKVSESNWHFVESDFYDLGQTLPTDVTFDAIILSNIYEYLNYGENVSKEIAKKYLNFIKTVLLPKLNQGGAIMSAYLYRFDNAINEFIANQLSNNPTGWVPSANLIAGLSNIETMLSGYTGQDVSYHYLYEEACLTPGMQKVKTRPAGFGMSSVNTDLALIQRK